MDRVKHELAMEGVAPEDAQARADLYIASMDKHVKNNQGVFVYFAFEEDNYLTFASWLEQTLSYIKEQNAIIAYYEKIAKQRNEKPKQQDTEND